MQTINQNYNSIAIRLLSFVTILSLLLFSSCTGGGAGPGAKGGTGGQNSVIDGPGTKRYLIDVSMTLSPKQSDSNLSADSPISDISIAITCAQVAKTLFTLPKAQAEISLASLAAGCRIEIFSFSLANIKYNRKIAFNKLSEGGAAYFESNSGAYGLSVRIGRQLPNPLQEKSPFVLTIDEIEKGKFDPNAPAGGDPGSGEAPPFSISYSAGNSNSTFTFTCLSPVVGAGEASTCEDLKIATLRFAIGLRPAESQLVKDPDVDKFFMGSKKISTLNPSYFAPDDSTNGGFSISVATPAGSHIRRLLVVLFNDSKSPAIGRTFWELRLFPHVYISTADSEALSMMNGFGISTVTDGDAQVFSRTGGANLTAASDLFEVDTNSSYSISGQFKSTGTTPAKLYFGLSPYDANKLPISASQVIRNGNGGTISSISDASITTIETLTGWSSSPVPPATAPTFVAYARALGFYFDGDLNKLPEVLYRLPAGQSSYSTSPEHGTFSTATGHTIAINGGALPKSITDRIENGVSKVMNHSSGGSYLYIAAGGGAISSDWRSFQGHISGVAWENIVGKFRPETMYVKIIILLNYQQDSTATTLFDRVLLEKDPS